MADKTPESSKKNLTDILIEVFKCFFFVALAVSLIGLYYYSRNDHSAPLKTEAPVYIDSWTVSDPAGNVFTEGRSYRNNGAVRGTFTIVSKIPENVRDNSVFCFIVGGDCAVYVNGEKRADFLTKRDMAIPGGIVKRFYMTVPVSAKDAGTTVKILRIDTTRRGYVYQDTFVTTSENLFPLLMTRYGLPLMLAEILLIFSLVIVVISFTLRFLYKRRIEMLYGALGILVISGWIITNSFLYPFIYGHYHVDGVINYLLCMLMPFNLVLYLNGLQKGRYRILMLGCLIISTLNILAWSILHFTETYLFPNALIFINLILGIQILIVFGTLIADTVRGKVKEYRYTAIGFAGFLICCIFEIIELNFFTLLHEELPMVAGLAFLLSLTVIQQIEDLRKMRDEGERALMLSEAKTKFLASMSHEIRTPINSVLGMNEMILRENKDPVIADYAQNVKSSGKMLLMLVNDVLDFSKIEAGKMQIEMVQYKLSAVLSDIMPMLMERATEKHLAFKIKVEEDVPDGQISDEFRIRQVLVNLISNAIKYTDKGSVTFTIDGSYTAEDAYSLILRVADTGRGIREDDRKRLFEAFTRADVRKNRNIEGTGLGLAIVKSILDSLDGEIKVESTYGEGSEFTVTLPVDVYDKTPLSADFIKKEDHTAKAQTDAPAYLAPDAKILAVDDNRTNLRIVTLFLKRVGIVPDICGDGISAILMCKEKRYDLILLDHMMPEPDGIETLHRIRSEKDSLNTDTPAVVLTANAFTDSRQMYMEAGFSDYLTKPLNASLLEETVRKYLPEAKIRSASGASPASGE